MAELEVLTVTQVMDLLQLSRDTVYRLAAIGELPGRKVGRTWRFVREEIERYVRRRHREADCAARQDSETVAEVEARTDA